MFYKDNKSMEKEWCVLINLDTLNIPDQYSFHYESYDRFISDPPYKSWKLFRKCADIHEAINIIKILEEFISFTK